MTDKSYLTTGGSISLSYLYIAIHAEDIINPKLGYIAKPQSSIL